MPRWLSFLEGPAKEQAEWVVVFICWLYHGNGHDYRSGFDERIGVGHMVDSFNFANLAQQFEAFFWDGFWICHIAWNFHRPNEEWKELFRN